MQRERGGRQPAAWRARSWALLPLPRPDACNPAPSAAPPSALLHEYMKPPPPPSLPPHPQRPCVRHNVRAFYAPASDGLAGRRGHKDPRAASKDAADPSLDRPPSLHTKNPGRQMRGFSGEDSQEGIRSTPGLPACTGDMPAQGVE